MCFIASCVVKSLVALCAGEDKCRGFRCTTDTLLVLGLNGLLMGKGFLIKVVPLTTDTLLVLGLNGLSMVMGSKFLAEQSTQHRSSND